MLLHTELCHGHTAEALAEATGVHVTTTRRWKRGTPPPEPVRRFLTLLHTKDLGTLDARWKGWRLTQNGELASPEDWIYTPGEVRELTLFRERLSRAREIELRERTGPPPGTVLDMFSGAWTETAAPVADPRPVWTDVMREARAQRSPYPTLPSRRR